MPEFTYQDPFPLAADTTPFRRLTDRHVRPATFEEEEILRVEPEALSLVARGALREVEFFLRTTAADQPLESMAPPHMFDSLRPPARADTGARR